MSASFDPYAEVTVCGKTFARPWEGARYGWHNAEQTVFIRLLRNDYQSWRCAIELCPDTGMSVEAKADGATMELAYREACKALNKDLVGMLHIANEWL